MACLQIPLFRYNIGINPSPQGGEGEKMMDERTKTTIRRRLASAAGHLKGIERMVGEDAYCIDTIQQIQAVQAALSKVNTMLLDTHLHTCVSQAVKGDDPGERERMLQEVTSVFTVASKLSVEKHYHE